MSDMRLYSWFDVETVLARARYSDTWPSTLISLRVFDDSITIGVENEAHAADAYAMLERVFGRRYNPKDQAIILESLAGGTTLRQLPVEVEVDEDLGSRPRPRLNPRPSFARVSVLPDDMASTQKSLPAPLPPDWPLVLAFYSYKGGVGRTLHVLATVKALLERSAGRPKILLVDADLEAPGLTWWARAQGVPAEVSFLDLLSLAHYDDDAYSQSVELVAQRIKQQPLTVKTDHGSADLFFLPTFRDEDQVFRMHLRPEHLVQTAGREWAVTELLAKLGHRLGADIVIVDLRAGISELSSPLLFDPRIIRALVTTTSSQAVEGTKLVLKQVKKIAPPPTEDSDYFDPTVIISMVPPELVDSEVPNIMEELLKAYPKFRDEKTARLRTETSTFAQQLLHLENFDKAITKLAGAPPFNVMQRLCEDWIPGEGDPYRASNSEKTDARRILAEIAHERVVAESGSTTDFLRTGSLKSLGSRFQFEPPVAVVMGAKGSGKTFAYLQLARRRSWSHFLSDLDLANSGDTWGHVWPLTYPLNLEARATATLTACRMNTLESTGTASTMTRQYIVDAIREELQKPAQSESHWRGFWLSLISESLGFGTPAGDPITHIHQALQSANIRLLVTMDGLEDIFKDFSQPSHQVAVRALCQDVLNALRELPDQRLGLLVFVRKDIIKAVIPQNFAQFENLYARFELKWNPEEALRLAVWICNEAGLRGKFLKLPGDLVTAPREQLERAMVGVWGLKLGQPHSREATTSDWVRDALSDFKGQLQARDIVRFLHYAAIEAQKRDEYDGRLLQPAAVRNAVQSTSVKKIEEIKVEMQRLEEIFAKFELHRERSIPFTPEQYSLDPSEIRFLEDVGVILEDNDVYYMPEIFRAGLGFGLEGRARPKVLSLMRKALGVR